MWVLTDLDNDAGNAVYKSAGGELENSPTNMYVFTIAQAMIATLLSTFFGVGYARVAPGTVASAVALPFAWLISWKLGRHGTADRKPRDLCASASGPAAYMPRGRAGVDPSECVIDEVAGQWLACAVRAAFARSALPSRSRCFASSTSRKLWPVSLGERLPGGWGIMTDDMIAGALSAAIIAGLRWQGLI